MKFKTLTAFTTLSAIALPFSAIAGGSSTVGPGNPAAIFCLKQGGSLETLSYPEGNDALCNFGKQSGIPQWTFFDAKREKTPEAIRIFLRPKPVKVGVNGNPAALYCEAQGGEARIAQLENDSEIGICHFADGSGIEAWTLFRGARDVSNAELVEALR